MRAEGVGVGVRAHATDEALVRLAQAGSQAASAELVLRFQRAARAIASNYFIVGADRDDVDQEALIAITVAIRSFREDSGVPFSRFLSLCVNRWLTTCVVRAQRKKHRFLTESVRVAVDDGDVFTIDDLASDARADVEQLVIDREEVRRICERFRSLSDLERAAVVGIANGESYAEIEGVPAGTPVKRIDNAVQRARRKLAAENPSRKEQQTMARETCKTEGCDVIPEQQYGPDAGFCPRHAKERREARKLPVKAARDRRSPANPLGGRGLR